MPIVGFLNSRYALRLQKTKLATDSRLKLVRELLSAIRIIKYYAWEAPFEANIQKFRAAEVDRQKETTTVRISGISVFAAVSPISTGLIFSLYAIANVFQVSTIFTTLSLVNTLRLPFQFLPLVIVFSSQYGVALTRVREFCLRPEPAHKSSGDLKKSRTAISFKDASLSWDSVVQDGSESTVASATLSDMSFKVKRGNIAMIVGSVGSGKSTLAAGVLGEVPHVRGKIDVSGSIAYVPQEAWIINATVRSNILFGKPYDEKLYKEVVGAAALETDFQIMPAGDSTEIGDRGINLSGGQKQRVSIARALYADRDIYVFDDPFSAVDSHVAKHLINNAVGKFLRSRGKTAFIVTNQLQFLHVADQIIFLKGGRVAEQGSFASLMASENGDFKQLVKEFGLSGNASSDSSDSVDSTKSTDSSEEANMADKKTKKSKRSKSEKLNLTSPDVTRAVKVRKSVAGPKEPGAAAPSNAEEIQKGAITAATYWYYISSGGIGLFSISILLMLAIAAGRVFNSIWLSWWSDPNPTVSGRYARDTCPYASISSIVILPTKLTDLCSNN